MLSLRHKFPEPVAAKVPAVTAMFWVIKVLTTGMGESAADAMAKVNILLCGVVGVAGFWLAMRRQLMARHYDARTYWLAVAMVAVFGTMVADALHIVLGLPYWVTSLSYAAAVAACFIAWRRSEGTLSIHSIVTTRRELFYWCTVLATFALGTAVGDLTGMSLGLGFLASGLMFLVAILIPLAIWRVGGNPVAMFWVAYVLTRPLGASFADWLGKEHSVGGGLGFGDALVAGALIVLIVALVAAFPTTAQPTRDLDISGVTGSARQPRWEADTYGDTDLLSLIDSGHDDIGSPTNQVTS